MVANSESTTIDNQEQQFSLTKKKKTIFLQVARPQLLGWARKQATTKWWFENFYLHPYFYLDPISSF